MLDRLDEKAQILVVFLPMTSCSGMNGTSWLPKRNPQFAAGIITTGADFEKMLHKMLTYEFLGKKVLSEMEKDWSAAPVSPSGDGWFGHYGGLAVCFPRIEVCKAKSRKTRAQNIEVSLQDTTGKATIADVQKTKRIFQHISTPRDLRTEVESTLFS